MNDQAFNQVLESLLDGEPRDFTPESLSPEQRHELIEFLAIEAQLRDAFSRPGSFAAGVMKALECDSSSARQQFREEVLRGNRRRRGVSLATFQAASFYTAFVNGTSPRGLTSSLFWHFPSFVLLVNRAKTKRQSISTPTSPPSCLRQPSSLCEL
jgi:hypothetical protein